MEAILTTTAVSTISGDGTGTVWYDVPMLAEKPPKTVTLAANARVNKKTLASGNPSAIVDKVKKQLIKDLMEQLIHQSLIKVSTDVGATSGRTTFTCTLEVVDPREQAKS